MIKELIKNGCNTVRCGVKSFQSYCKIYRKYGWRLNKLIKTQLKEAARKENKKEVK